MSTVRDRGSASWWVAPVIGLVVLFTAAGGLAARTIYQHPAATASNNSPTVAPSATGTSATTNSAPPGSPVVQLLPDAASYPGSGQVRAQLQTLFDAINTLDYQKWRTVVTATRAEQFPKASWLNGYEDSKDGSIQVYRIDVAPQGGLRVLLTFVSEQDLAHAPSFAPYTCIRWREVWPLSWEDEQWKLDTGVTNTTPEYERC